MATPIEKPDSEASLADDQPQAGQLNLIEETRKKYDIAKAQIDSAYAEKRKKIDTPMADFNEGVVLSVLKALLNSVQEQEEREIAANDGKPLSTKRVAEFEKRRKEAVNFATFYIQRMAKENSGITAEVLAKMVDDINHKASTFADLLISGQYHDLGQAALASLGWQGESADLPTAKKDYYPAVTKELEANFDKGDGGVMTYVWSVMSFMDKDDRIKIAKDFCRGKIPAQKTEFLKRGNVHGVFDSEEMQAINPQHKYSEQEVAQLQQNWQIQNDFKAQATQLGIVPYGTENAAGKTMNLRNGLLFFLKVGAGVTIVGNFVTGVSQGGEFKGIGEAIKRVTNPQSLAAAAVYTAIKVGESKQTFTDIISGKDPKKEALANLKKEKKGNPLWPQWNEFFTQKDFSGAQVFSDYIQNLKKAHDETDLDKLAKYITPANFKDFLDRMVAAQKEGKATKSFNYADLRDGFNKINPSQILTFAKIFDALNLGGKQVADTYAQAVKDTDNLA